MDYSLLALHRGAPHRPPDWRWRLANVIASGGADHPAVLAAADLWVAQALTLIDDHRQGEGERPPGSTALGAAHGVYTGEDQLRRWEVEARLLSGTPLEQVATQCGLPLEVLGAYHEVFFHVHDRLLATSYIAHHVIGPKLHHGLTEDDVGVLLKVAAWRGRGLFLEMMIRYFRSLRAAPGGCIARDPGAITQRWERLLARKWVLCQVCPAGEVALAASEIMTSVDRCMELPTEGEEVSAESLAAGLRVAEQAFDQLRSVILRQPGAA